MIDSNASARRSRAKHSFFTQPWLCSGLARLLLFLILLLLGAYPASPARALAHEDQRARYVAPAAGQPQDSIGPTPTDANAIGALSLATTPARQAVPVNAAGASAPTMPEPLRAALAFNIFITGDLIQRQSITYGRIAVGGNARLERYRIGDTMPKSRDNRADLIVGGTLIFTDGLVAKGGIVAGGRVSIAKVGIPHGRLREGLPIDFGAQSAALSQLAASLSRLPPNGLTQIRDRRDQRKQIMLTGTDRQINIFAMAGRDLAEAQTLIFSIPAGATVLVNIDGAADQIQNIGFALGTINRNRILYNFYEATELKLDDDRIQGSILAPHAGVTFVSGRLNGTLIGATLTGTGVAWPDPFIGQLPALHDTISAAGAPARASLTSTSPSTTAAR